MRGDIQTDFLTVFGKATVLVWMITATVWAQTTAFTYQGKLTEAGQPANDNYDLHFKLFDTVTVGTSTHSGGAASSTFRSSRAMGKWDSIAINIALLRS